MDSGGRLRIIRLQISSLPTVRVGTSGSSSPWRTDTTLWPTSSSDEVSLFILFAFFSLFVRLMLFREECGSLNRVLAEKSVQGVDFLCNCRRCLAHAAHAGERWTLEGSEIASLPGTAADPHRLEGSYCTVQFLRAACAECDSTIGEGEKVQERKGLGIWLTY